VKILLVTPKNPPSFWTYDQILPTLGKRCIFPNLSMPTLAGLTGPEHEVVLVDENVEVIDFDLEADIVGVTGYIVHRKRIREILAGFRERGRFVVVGGPYASLCSEELSGLADVVFVDEAEETWPHFLRDFATGSWKSEYRAQEKPDISLAPAPRFDLLDVSKYHALTIQFARGCPFNCEFCDIIVMYGRRPRAKGVEQLMAEVRECHRLGATQVFIVDDNFIGNRKLAKQLLRSLAEWGAANDYPLDFNTEVSLDVAQDEELLELMRDAHFTTIFIGIESPREASLLETRKTQNTRGDLVESVRRVQSYGMQVQAGMIVGFDADDPSIFEEQLRFIQDARIPVSMTGLLQALPKTPLHARVEKEGRLLAESGGDQFLLSNIEPVGMTRLELYRGYRWLVSQLYDYRHYRERALDFLLTRGSQVHSGMNVRSGDLRRLGRILLETLWRGGPGRARFTLSLLFSTLWRRPSVFKEAVSFAIVHKAFHAYVGDLVEELDRLIAGLEGDAGQPGTLGTHTATDPQHERK
jgi:radical SAM superfamily enzyme YgiQ (UPF0313 family)